MTRATADANTSTKRNVNFIGWDTSSTKVVKTSDEMVEALSTIETNSDGRKVSIPNPLDMTSETEIDSISLLVSISDPLDITSETEIDSISLLVKPNTPSEVSVMDIISVMVLVELKRNDGIG